MESKWSYPKIFKVKADTTITNCTFHVEKSSCDYSGHLYFSPSTINSRFPAFLSVSHCSLNFIIFEFRSAASRAFFDKSPVQDLGRKRTTNTDKTNIGESMGRRNACIFRSPCRKQPNQLLTN